MCVLLAAVDIGMQIGIQFVTNCKQVDVNIGSSSYLTGVASHLLQFGVSWCSYIVVQCIAFKMLIIIIPFYSSSLLLQVLFHEIFHSYSVTCSDYMTSPFLTYYFSQYVVYLNNSQSFSLCLRLHRKLFYRLT